MTDKGLFITFEGPDGSGKTTQIHQLAEELERRGRSFILTREPGGTTIGDAIRSIILNPEHTELADHTEILLYAASRSQHVSEKIQPALKAGKIVLCDRFVDASIAYQGYGLGEMVATVKQINDFATGGLTPDRTYMIDIAPEIGRQRMKRRSGVAELGAMKDAADLDRIEMRALAYHQRVREGFHAIYEENKQRIRLIDGAQDQKQVHRMICDDFFQFIRRFD
ncbi:dTMP kinase [Sporolactobacillus terrae]|uniref:Thymidylate kinase n=1 Tax=Sporolactobacillus terrae TaxID=269673 RepID=A0A410DCT3_9BACL|nr:dTMP kinase [Sporolactobacillus terrae]QAA23917.1 dTMP kinase [Sporolactobacillus terrae]QAA26886.1 dTMP kinase [Sporolactobacillus terrae]BBN97337.1 thymidylate kinase [Sporolactobacillus terrae]